MVTVRAHARSAAARAAHLGAFKFLSTGRSDVGCVRSLNEDAFLDRSDIGLWAVADGMGGHDCGDLASGMIVAALAEVRSFSSAHAFRDGVCAALQRVNEGLVEKAGERGGGPIGATVVALLAHQGHYACVWAGDSRAYLYRAGELRRLTRDHSLVQELFDAGRLSEDDRRLRGNVVTRAVGGDRSLELAGVHGRIEPGDRFLLCSDGLSNTVEDREIAEILRRPPLQAAVDRLIERTLSRGAPDNVTALVVGAELSEPLRRRGG